MTVLSIDPGKNIGRALWTNDGKLLFKDICDLDTFLSYLAEAEGIGTIVYENWRLFKRQAQQTGSTMEASQVIGAIKLWEKLDSTRLRVEQPSSILPVSALHAGVALPKGHTPDDVSAYLHGHYYFVGLGLLTPQSVD